MISKSFHVTEFFPVALLRPDRFKIGRDILPDAHPPNLYHVIPFIQRNRAYVAYKIEDNM